MKVFVAIYLYLIVTGCGSLLLLLESSMIFTKPIYLYCAIFLLLIIYALPFLLYYCGLRVIPVKTNFSQDITNCLKLIVAALFGLFCITVPGTVFAGVVFVLFWGMQALPLFWEKQNIFYGLGQLVVAVIFTYFEAKFLGSYWVVSKKKYNE
ncbi:MAG: hypothetical protein RRY34_09530, partial [Victivallaceae bacterium]